MNSTKVYLSLSPPLPLSMMTVSYSTYLPIYVSSAPVVSPHSIGTTANLLTKAAHRPTRSSVLLILLPLWPKGRNATTKEGSTAEE